MARVGRGKRPGGAKAILKHAKMLGGNNGVAVLESNGNPLHEIPRHLLLPPVIEPSRSRIGMPEEVLDVLDGHALVEEVGGRRHAERMRRERLR